MARKYHITPKTGRPNICRASSPETCLYEAMGAVAEANKRLERYGIPERFTVEVEKFSSESHVLGSGVPVTSNWATAPALSLHGYTFLAAVDDANEGYVVRTPRDVELGGWRPTSQYCEHCVTVAGTRDRAGDDR